MTQNLPPVALSRLERDQMSDTRQEGRGDLPLVGVRERDDMAQQIATGGKAVQSSSHVWPFYRTLQDR